MRDHVVCILSTVLKLFTNLDCSYNEVTVNRTLIISNMPITISQRISHSHISYFSIRYFRRFISLLYPGLYYCQSSGLYYDTKMSVFYTLENGKYVYHSSAKPDDTKSGGAVTLFWSILRNARRPLLHKDFLPSTFVKVTCVLRS